MAKVLSVLFFILIVFEGIGFSQTRATTEDGRKVILQRNGTWQYSASIHPTAPCLRIDPAESPSDIWQNVPFTKLLPFNIFECNSGFCKKTGMYDPNTEKCTPISEEPDMGIPKELKRMQSSMSF